MSRYNQEVSLRNNYGQFVFMHDSFSVTKIYITEEFDRRFIVIPSITSLLVFLKAKQNGTINSA